MTLPIPVPMAIATFFTMWWTVLFAVLPFGVRSQHEGETVVPGTEPGAPQRPLILRKAMWTTVATAVLFTLLLVVLSYFPDS